ncbi:MAG: integrin alpha, partial [Phycisphaerae bacterium]
MKLIKLLCLVLSFTAALTDSSDASKAEKPSPSLPSKLSFMDTVADKIFTGEPNTTSRLGQSVVLGKDINGDGYGDMFLGAPYYKNIQGRVYIYYGGKNATFDV